MLSTKMNSLHFAMSCAHSPTQLMQPTWLESGRYQPTSVRQCSTLSYSLVCCIPSSALDSFVLFSLHLKQLGFLLLPISFTTGTRLRWSPTSSSSSALYTPSPTRQLGATIGGNHRGLSGCLRGDAGRGLNPDVGVPLSRGEHSHL